MHGEFEKPLLHPEMAQEFKNFKAILQNKPQDFKASHRNLEHLTMEYIQVARTFA